MAQKGQLRFWVEQTYLNAELWEHDRGGFHNGSTGATETWWLLAVQKTHLHVKLWKQGQSGFRNGSAGGRVA